MEKLAVSNIGFIGLGNIGNPCARVLAENDFPLTLFDLNKNQASNVLEKGAQWADSLENLARHSDIILMSLPGPAEVESVVNQLLEHIKQNAIIIDLSTNSLSTVRRLYSVCAKKNIAFIDSPVSGGAWAAETGDLTLMPSGNQAAFNRAKNVLDAIGKDVQFLGESGTGTLVKLINNQVFICSGMIFQEGLLMAAKAGLDLPSFYKVLKNSSGGFYMPLTDITVQRLWEKENSSYALALAEKDVGLALESARDLKVPAPVTAAAHQILVSAVANGLGEKFYFASMEAMEQQANIQFEKFNPNQNTSSENN
jgi:3-hydroxyisobutyrate dehydrogenase-like beta-hydroxyacid dehydrogenase